MAWFVDLPVEQEIAITALVVGLVAVGIEFLISYVPWLAFLANYKQEWGLALAAVVITALENWLPSAYPEVSIAAVALVLAIFAAVGFVRKLMAKRASKLL